MHLRCWLCCAGYFKNIHISVNLTICRRFGGPYPRPIKIFLQMAPCLEYQIIYCCRYSRSTVFCCTIWKNRSLLQVSPLTASQQCFCSETDLFFRLFCCQRSGMGFWQSNGVRWCYARCLQKWPRCLWGAVTQLLYKKGSNRTQLWLRTTCCLRIQDVMGSYMYQDSCFCDTFVIIYLIF